VRVLSSRFRNLYIRYLKKIYAAEKLRFYGELQHLSSPASFARYLAPLRRRKWVVYAKAPFGGPDRMLDYLGRYTHRVAISNNRLQELTEGQVTFAYKDYKHEHQHKLMTLSADEFLRRFLLHVLPDGFQRIRHYGLLSNRHRTENLARCRELLSMPALIPQPQQNYRERYQQLTGHDLLLCPRCIQGHMLRIGFPIRFQSLWRAPYVSPFILISARLFENNTVRYCWCLLLTTTSGVLSGFLAIRRPSKHIA
jgi:hypothetical protein